MKPISLRRAGAAVGAAALLAVSVAAAGPAAAFPANSWWYGELSVAKAQQVTKGAGVTVAVLDTGVQASLPDLTGQVLPGRSFTGGGDPRTDLPDSRAHYFGHGTAVAGYIAGTGRGAGMVGIAPKAKILPVRVASSSTSIDLGAVAQAIPWAVQHGAKIVNLSVAASSACSPDMQAAVDYAVRRNVIVVAGSGNTPGASVGSPANCIGVLAVGGTSESKSFVPWSGESYGPQLDFVAPADHMRDLLLTNQLSNPDGTGTSIATALVSGTFALLRAKFPGESARSLVTRALYNVHNGLPDDTFAKRIDDKLGYGEILPSYALTEAPPKGARNPIYDAVDKHLAGSSTGASSAPSSAASSSGPAPAPSQAGSGGSSTGVSGGVVAAIIGGVVVLAAVIALVAARGRRRPRAGGYGPPPPGYRR